MERRYLAFFAVSFAVLVLWNSMFPPPVPVKPHPPVANEAAEGEQPNEAGDKPLALDAGLPSIPPAPVVVAPVVKSPPFVTLGSVDPEGQYRLLTLFDTRGATIRRLELASGQFRDLHDESGYLGQLELVDAPGGAKVQVVGPGTPAAKAGLEKDDVIVALRSEGNPQLKGGPIAQAEEVAAQLALTEPGDTVELTIQRGNAAKQLAVKLIRRPLDVIRPEVENLLLHRKTVPEDYETHPSLEISLAKIGPQPPADADLKAANEQLAAGVWAVNQPSADSAEFSMTLPQLGLEVIKRFEIAQIPEDQHKNRDYPGYHLQFDVEIRNLRAEPQSVTYQLQGPNGLPIEGWWYSNKVGRTWSGYGLRDVVLRVYGATEKDFPCRKIAEGDVEPYGDGKSLAYIGVDAQYFAAALLPHKEAAADKTYALFTPNLASTLTDAKRDIKLKYANVSFLLTSRALLLEAGGSVTDSATLFAGPKRPELLEHYHAAEAPEVALDDFVYYGYFGNLGIPQLMVWILGVFYSIVRNYGVAIILLTVLVRSCMFPLSRKQAKNMMMMQELKPEMDRIAARHKDDATARTKAQQELWAKHNYNPMGGCLLMFVQLPIFIGLYRGLMVDVELRQASLIPGLRWCSNLAAPDMLLNWSGWWPEWFVNGEGMLALGPYLNILPLTTVGLFLLQQKLFMPPAVDDQAIMMQKMMKFMMIFMSFMFFKVAAGLCLYFIASSLWGIAERKLIPPPTKPDGSQVSTPSPAPTRDPPARKKRSGGKGGGKRKR